MKLILALILIPLSRMKKVDVESFLTTLMHKNLFYPEEKIYSAYDNFINSFLVTNTRIIGILKLKVKGEYRVIKIFSVPLFQLGTLGTYHFRSLKTNAICITSSPGFNFYWFFKVDVSMENLSNEISKVVADVQISGGSKLDSLS